MDAIDLVSYCSVVLVDKCYSQLLQCMKLALKQDMSLNMNKETVSTLVWEGHLLIKNTK